MTGRQARLARDINGLVLAALSDDGAAMDVLTGSLDAADAVAVISALASIAADILREMHGHAEALALLRRHALELAGAG